MNNLNYLKDSIFKCFLKSIIGFYFFLKKKIYAQHIMMESLSFEEESIIKDIKKFLN